MYYVYYANWYIDPEPVKGDYPELYLGNLAFPQKSHLHMSVSSAKLSLVGTYLQCMNSPPDYGVAVHINSFHAQLAPSQWNGFPCYLTLITSFVSYLGW